MTELLYLNVLKPVLSSRGTHTNQTVVRFYLLFLQKIGRLIIATHSEKNVSIISQNDK